MIGLLCVHLHRRHKVGDLCTYLCVCVRVCMYKCTRPTQEVTPPFSNVEFPLAEGKRGSRW